MEILVTSNLFKMALIYSLKQPILTKFLLYARYHSVHGGYSKTKKHTNKTITKTKKKQTNKDLALILL